MAWKRMETSEGTSYGQGAYIKVDPGQSIIGVIIGEPLTYKNHYKLGRCKETADCPHCKHPDKEMARPSSRFDANFVTLENGVWVCKVLSSGKTLFNNIVAISEECDLGTWKVKLTKTGDKKNPWNIMPMMKGEITPAEAAAIAKVDLKVDAPKEESPKQNFDQTADEDIPF